jgi:hypothetical protein
MNTNINEQKFTILCIPRIHSSVSLQYIKFYISILGEIKNIVEFQHKNNSSFKRIIIYIYLHKNTKTTDIIHNRFSNKDNFKLMYKFPYYWRIVEACNTSVPPPLPLDDL